MLTLDKILEQAEKSGLKYKLNSGESGGFYVTDENGTRRKVSLKEVLISGGIVDHG